jgi:hypothetical protein
VGQLLGNAGNKAKGVGLWYPRFSLAGGSKFGATGNRVFSMCNALDIVCDHRPTLHNPATLTGRIAMTAGTAIHMGYRLGPQLADLGAKVAAKLRKERADRVPAERYPQPDFALASRCLTRPPYRLHYAIALPVYGFAS